MSRILGGIALLVAAYLNQALAAILIRNWPTGGTILLFCTSPLVLGGIFVLLTARIYEVPKAGRYGIGIYVVVGFLLTVLYTLLPGYLPLKPEALLFWVAWPTMILWLWGCSLPLLTACP